MAHEEKPWLTPEAIKQVVKTAFDELDPIQMAIFHRMTPAQKGQAVADLFTAMRQLALVSERHRHPDLPDEEIHRRAMLRLMRSSEWESEWMKRIFGLLPDDQSAENTPT